MTNTPMDKSLSRRQLLQGVGAAGISVILSEATGSKLAVAQSPKKGGSFRMALDGGATTDTFDLKVTIGTPHISQSINMCMDSLVEQDSDSNPVPGLAESWESSEDGKKWVFRLRKGVEFHDGKTLTPDDVIFSLKRVGAEDSTFPDGKLILSNIATIKGDGSDVVIELKEVNYDLALQLGGVGMQICPDGTTDFNKGVGTGPYVLESFEPGVRTLLKKSPKFYREDQGFFDSIEILNVLDLAARNNALQSDLVDMIMKPDAKTAKLLGQVAGIELLEVGAGLHYTSPMRTDVKPFDDNNVRLAVKHAINREEFVGKILGGYGYVNSDQPIGKSYRFYDAGLVPHPYDPDKAKFHLKEAGYQAIGLELSASEGAFAGCVDAAQLMKELAAAAGINIDIKQVSSDGYWSGTWTKAPWCFCYWNGRPTADWMLSQAYGSGSDWNDTKYKSEAFDKLLVDARRTRDDALRREIYGQAQRMLHEEGGAIVLGFGNFLYGISKKVGHGKLNGSAWADWHSAGRRWWFA